MRNCQVVFYIREGKKTLNQKLTLYWAAKPLKATDAACISAIKIICVLYFRNGYFLQQADMLKKKNVG